jgi:hypothetical protein
MTTKDNALPAEDPTEAPPRQWVDRLNEKAAIDVPGNTIRLLASDKDHAFIIRFDKNPNEGLAPGEKHPALALIREQLEDERAHQLEGHSPGAWMFSKVDGKGGWHFRWPLKEGEQFSRYNTPMKERLETFIREQLAPALGGAQPGLSR